MEDIQIGNLRLVVAPEIVALPKEQGSAKSLKVMRKVRSPKHVSQAKQILARASLYKVENVRLVGHGAMIKQAMTTNGWLVMPFEMYDGIIPREVKETAERLTKDISIKGLLIADDLRRVHKKQSSQAVPVPDWKKIASGAGRVAAIIAVAGAVISILPLVLGLGAVFTVFAYDPLLIAVTAEDEWICLYEWWH